MSREAIRINPDVVRDDSVREALVKETALKAELAALRKPMRELQDKKDESIRTFQPKQEKFMSKVDGEWETLQKEKNELHAKMDKLKVDQHERGQMIDELRMVGMEIDPVRREVVECKTKRSDLQSQIKEIEEKRSRVMATLRFKSQSEADEEITRIEKEIAEASKKGEQKLAAAFVKQKNAAEKAKKDVVASYNIDDRLIALKRKETAVSEALTQKEAELEKLDTKRKTLREKLDAAGGKKEKGGDDPFKVLLDKVKVINGKLDVLRAKRKEERPVNSELDSVNAEIAATKERREAIAKELDALKPKLHSQKVSFDPQFRGDIIGKGGATIEQLQTDFGVAIHLDEDTLVLTGGPEDCEACADAVKSILEGIKENRQKETIKFDMKLVRPFIGTGGSNIQRIQTASGAEVKLRKEEGTIDIIGNTEAIATAKAMIEDFVKNNASHEMKFDPSLRDIVIGRGGSTIRQIEADSGVKRLHVDRDRHMISMTGSEEAVEKAKALYTDLIEGMTSNAFTMRVDDRMTRLVIGPGGKTINEIQDTTKALVECRNGTITIRGGKDAVAAARRMIEDITRREEIKIPFDSCLFQMLTTRPLLTREDDEDGSRVQQEEGETPLESIKRMCSCDQVSAIRSESKIVVRGKQQNVNQARTMIDDLLRSNRPEVGKVAFPEIMTATILKRGSDRNNYLDRIKLQFTGLIHCDLDRSTGSIEVAGGKDDVLKAVAEIKDYVGKAQENMRTKHVPGSAIGAVIGPQGSTIAELQRKHTVEIKLDRDANPNVTVWSVAGNAEDLDAAISAIEAIVGPPRTA